MDVVLNLLASALLRPPISGNVWIIIFLIIVLACLLFWLCKKYFKKNFSEEKTEEQIQDEYIPERIAVEDGTMVERIHSDLAVSEGSPVKGKEYFRESKYQSPNDTREFQIRLFLNEGRFKSRIEEEVKRSLSGCFPVKYLRNFRMDKEACDFIIHWQDRNTKRWKCVLMNCKFSFSFKESSISNSLDEAISRVDQCCIDLEKYGTNDVELKVIVVNFPIPESYEPFNDRHDIIFLNHRSVSSFIKYLTEEIFNEQRLSKGFAWIA